MYSWGGEFNFFREFVFTVYPDLPVHIFSFKTENDIFKNRVVESWWRRGRVGLYLKQYFALFNYSPMTKNIANENLSFTG